MEGARNLCPPDEGDAPNDVIREFRGASFQRVAAGKAGDAMSAIVCASSTFRDVLAKSSLTVTI
jgi:hypothetical protein